MRNTTLTARVQANSANCIGETSGKWAVVAAPISGANARTTTFSHFELRCGAKHSQFAGDYRTGRGDPTLRVRVEHKKIAPEQSAGAIPFDALLHTHCIPRRPAADLDIRGLADSHVVVQRELRPARCRCLLVWASLAEPHLACGNASAGRWLESALRGDPAGGLRAMELAPAEHPSEHTKICCTQQRAVATVRRMAAQIAVISSQMGLTPVDFDVARWVSPSRGQTCDDHGVMYTGPA